MAFILQHRIESTAALMQFKSMKHAVFEGDQCIRATHNGEHFFSLTHQTKHLKFMVLIRCRGASKAAASLFFSPIERGGRTCDVWA